MKDDSREEDHSPSPEDLAAFMAAFHKLWDWYERTRPDPPERTPTGDPCDPYEPAACPGSGDGGGLPAMCESINEWAACWKAWGDAVHRKLWPGPDNPAPPPPPPFD